MKSPNIHRKHVYHQKLFRSLWSILIFLLLMFSWIALFPSVASAHAILLRSNPAQDSVLKQAPTQVQMWFSENLNPTLTTAYVVDTAHSTAQSMNDKTTHVDLGNAHILSSNTEEMDVSLKPNLPAAVYLVFYRTQSADDGHILSGSFLFTIEAANGTVPTFHGSLPSTSTTASTSGQLDGPTFFSFLMITLVELGAVFWVGAQLWRTFVIQLIPPENHEQQIIYQEVERRFDRLFSIPTLLLLFLANIGVLIGQGLVATSGQWLQALSPAFLSELIANGQFGTFWIMREVVVLLALLLAFSHLVLKVRTSLFQALFSWGNLLLSLALLIALTLSGHAAAARSDLLVSSLLVDCLHLLAASLWIGGILFIATCYLPVLKGKPFTEQTTSLLDTLKHYSPLAITGVIIMSTSGPFNAVVHISTWEQLLTTAYGRTLIVKVLLVGTLLLTSAIHVFLLRPRLRKEAVLHAKAFAATRQIEEAATSQSESSSVEQVKTIEGRMQQQTLRLCNTLRWEALPAIAVLVCTGLLSVFAGTLLPASSSQASAPPVSVQQTVTPAKPLITTLKTSDGKFTIQLTVSPNRQGPNTFTVHVLNKTGQQQTNIGVSIYTTMLDMDMGTDSINLQPNKGNFQAQGDFSMSGNWQLRVEIRTPDNTLHEARVKLVASA